MAKTLLILATTVALSLAFPEERLQQYEPRDVYDAPHRGGFNDPQGRDTPYKEEPARPYEFNYGVRDEYSGANYGHSEVSSGDAVEGSYQVALPDGRIQIVKYVADHLNGFQAKVEYQGEARYPEHVPHKQPSYGKEAPPHHQPQRGYQPQYKSAPQEPQNYQDILDETPIYTEQ